VIITIECRCACALANYDIYGSDGMVAEINVGLKANCPFTTIIVVCACAVCIVGIGSTITICIELSPLCRQGAEVCKCCRILNVDGLSCAVNNNFRKLQETLKDPAEDNETKTE
jgi:hypothetical protein